MSTEEIEEIENEELMDESAGDLISLFLEKLVPPDEIIIHDLYGEQYELRTRISARSQIKLIREFEKGMKGVSLKEVIAPDEELTTSVIIGAVMKVAVKDAVLNSVDKCFQIAHPHAMDSARANAKNDPHAPKKPTALDLFGLEDILGAILPLFLGLTKKGANLLALLAQ